ncbi:MAG: N-acetylmuramoyl-L-alanine amidase [Eubacteriales bacterium]|nr:N-acetylmuramoyl-L-alanine amidase [Eubacteriales bacterium]
MRRNSFVFFVGVLGVVLGSTGSYGEGLWENGEISAPSAENGEISAPTTESGEGMLSPSHGDEGGSLFSQQASEEMIYWDESWPYAEFSQIHSDGVKLYHAANSNGIVVAVNAGHGTAGGDGYQTLCHPDGTPKVTGGSTAAGATYATAVSGGTTMLDGTPEPTVTLSLAQLLKTELLERGFDVLMIRDGEDAQLDNIARTVFANQNANCHLALHYDSTENDKGFFYIGVPQDGSYLAMEPVASHWQQHMALGNALLEGMQNTGNKIYSTGIIELDLTQTSYSMVPSVDVEVGDRGSDYSEATQQRIAEGLADGLQRYFGVG